MPQTKRSSFRLDDEHMQMIDEIADYQGGLTKTRVVEWALERLHEQVIEADERNRRNADELTKIAKKNSKKAIPVS